MDPHKSVLNSMTVNAEDVMVTGGVCGQQSLCYSYALIIFIYPYVIRML